MGIFEKDDGSQCYQCSKNKSKFPHPHYVHCLGRKRPKVFPYIAGGKLIADPCPYYERK